MCRLCSLFHVWYVDYVAYFMIENFHSLEFSTTILYRAVQQSMWACEVMSMYLAALFPVVTAIFVRLIVRRLFWEPPQYLRIPTVFNFWSRVQDLASWPKSLVWIKTTWAATSRGRALGKKSAIRRGTKWAVTSNKQGHQTYRGINGQGYIRGTGPQTNLFYFFRLAHLPFQSCIDDGYLDMLFLKSAHFNITIQILFLG